MTSPLLALFSRSLIEDSRIKMTYAARAGLVLVVGVFMIIAVITSGWRGAPGLNFFTAIVHIQTVFITLAGLSYFASAITEEKEENMLGLLRMTDLDPLSILLGKSTSRLCGALLLLAAQLPFTLLAVTLGGITTRQIIAAYLALGAYTFFLCNLALLASVVSRRSGHAAAIVGAVLGLLWFAASAFMQLAGQSSVGAATSILRTLGAGLGKAATSTRLDEVLGTGFDGALVGWQFAFNIGAGLLFFGAAWAVFEHACDRSPAESTASSGAWLRRGLPPGRVWGRPLVWKDACFLHGGRGFAAVKFAGYGAALGVFFAYQWLTGAFSSTGEVVSTLFTASAFAFVAFLVELGLAASRMHRVEVQDGTFASLSLLPLSIAELHGAKVQSCHHAVLPVAAWTAITFAGGLVAAATIETDRLLAGVVFTFAIVIFYVLPQVMLYFNLVAWLSLKTPRGALPLGIVSVVLGNIFGGFLGMLMLGIGLFAIPFIAVFLAGVCRGKLLARLEELAAEG